ncbi:hypothetical protein C2E21_8239 [Chlorella sorokiniana]|uniref:Uncharacterized protein n=1 Tax=Chlorella sorokiniana TaxID=3076 RepID=A0A2P6TF43_CHLSO|nr:hypothetical protein C2E21_8239 [Chlorella sorokiniana]|eukprot:PRW32590.1 hypothetical protein C2E21_8239 [Chlorella sorokiniana]
MASTRNAYELLLGGGAPAVSSTGAAKKKKNKKKGGSGAAASEAALAAAPAATPVAAPVAAPAQPQVQRLRDAADALEAAAVAAQAGERGSLAQDWADQVFNSDALFADGSQLADFKQVLQKSRAVELLVDGCLSKGAFPFEAEPLAALLSAVAHPSVPRDYCQALATAACALGAVSATDPLAPAPAAKRSAAAALALALKGIPKPPPSKPAEAPAAKLKRLGGELGRQEARLPSTSAPKELCKVYASILELLCGQLDVLRPGGGAAAPHVPELAAALKPLDELRSALEARLQEVTAPKKPALSIEQQVAEAEAAYKKEEAASASRLTAVEARIRDLEAELAAAKAEAGDLRTRRASAAQHHTLRLQQIRSGKGESGASPEEIAAAVQGGLGAVEGLAAAVRSGGAPAGAADAAPSDAAALAQVVVSAEVPVKLLGATQQVVELSIAQLHELGGKASFFRERLDKAIKQGEQAAKLGVGDPKLFAQQRTMAEKNVKEVLAAAEAAAAGARAAVASYRERLPVLLRLPNFLPPPPEFVAALEGRAAEAEQLLGAVTSGTYVPPAAPAPAPAAAEAAPAAAPAPAPAPAAAPAAAPAGAGGAPLASAAGDLAALEARLAALEEENSKKDAQIAAMVSTSTLEVPSPLAGRTSMPPAMLSSPTSNKPVGLAAPIAPAPAAAAPGPAPAPAAAAPAAAAPAPIGAAAAAGNPPVITFSQMLASGGPAQANGRKPGRPRRA